MVFVLYKVCHKDNTISIVEVFENDNDAKHKMKQLTCDKTPEESLEESFSIQETWYTSTKMYNFPEPPFKYTEEDNSVDETDLESTTKSLSETKQNMLDFDNHFEKILNELSKRIVIKTIKVENDNTDLYLYVYLCFVMLVLLILTITITSHYIP
jgi:hypothetical protein